jgi:diguanylate cyclase (GGDEF)-like protein
MAPVETSGIVGAAARLGGTPDLAETLQGIAAAALTSLGAERATCYAYDVEAQVVSAVFTTEPDPERRAFLERTVGLGADRLPIWRLQLAQADPLLAIDDVSRSPDISPELAARLGSGAVLGVRLEHRSVQQSGTPALLGTLFCSYSRPRTFSPAERQAARGLAGLATMALANAHLQFETAQRLEENRVLAAEQAALRRVATLVATEGKPEEVFAQAAREVAALLGVECGLVARFEPDQAIPVGWWGSYQSQLDVPFPLGGFGALAQVARSGRAARVSDYQSHESDQVARIVRAGGYRSAVAAPVRVAGRLWGALLAATTQERMLDVDAEERLERFAALVALAIANAEAQARLASQAASDPLTGLANHGVFFERLHAEVQRARRNGKPLAVVLVDLDHFKSVNDVHGHLAGDDVLVETAGRLATLARAEDTVARIGGEEFAWLLPECDAHSAWAAGERARRAIADVPFPDVGRLTLSAGVAEFTDGMSVNDLFRAADSALYQAKAQGRDACVPYSLDQGQVVAVRPPESPGRLTPSVGRLLALAREQLGLALVAVGQFQGETQVWRYLNGDGGPFGIQVGGESPLDGSYCKMVVEGRLPNLVRDARREKPSRDLAVTHKAGIGAYAGVPISLPSGDLYGMLCCMSPRAEPELGMRDVRLLRILAGMIGEELGREEHATQLQRRQHERIRRVLDGEGLHIVFQPIVELSSGRVVAVEALSRFPDEPSRPPQVWFAEAAAVNLGVELELHAVRAALARIGDLPADARLSFNLSPSTVCAPALLDALRGAPTQRLAVELTEHAPVDDFDILESALAALRSRGVQLMIDDAGAGFSSLKRILGLHPDVIKLDLALTRDIDTDPVRRALAASLVAFARDTDVRIVAEGIETQGELDALRALGVTHGQGYHLAQPRPGIVPARVALGGPAALVTT